MPRDPRASAAHRPFLPAVSMYLLGAYLPDQKLLRVRIFA